MNVIAVILLVLAVQCGGIHADNIKKYWGPQPTIIKPVWGVVDIDVNGIIVSYQEKYGSKIDVECTGLWISDKEYRLTWKDSRFILLQRDNLISISSRKVQI